MGGCCSRGSIEDEHNDGDQFATPGKQTTKAHGNKVAPDTSLTTPDRPVDAGVESGTGATDRYLAGDAAAQRDTIGVQRNLFPHKPMLNRVVVSASTAQLNIRAGVIGFGKLVPSYELAPELQECWVSNGPIISKAKLAYLTTALENLPGKTWETGPNRGGVDNDVSYKALDVSKQFMDGIRADVMEVMAKHYGPSRYKPTPDDPWQLRAQARGSKGNSHFDTKPYDLRVVIRIPRDGTRADGISYIDITNKKQPLPASLEPPPAGVIGLRVPVRPGEAYAMAGTVGTSTRGTSWFHNVPGCLDGQRDALPNENFEGLSYILDYIFATED